MSLPAAAQEILDRRFAGKSWERSDAAWRSAVYALTDCYLDADQHGYPVTLEDLSAWARGHGWPRDDVIALVEMAHTVHHTLIRAEVISH